MARIFKALACATVLGATFSGAPAQAADPIKVGWIAPLTGAFSVSGAAETFGLKSEIDRINAAGGLLGRPLVLVTRDSASDPSKAVSVANELLFNEKVELITGPGSSGEAFPIMDIIANAKKLHITPTQAGPLIDVAKRPNAYRTLPPTEQMALRTAKFTDETLKLRKVAILADSTGYGTVLVDALKAEYDKLGIKPLLVTLINTNKADVTPEVLKARESGADVLQVWTNATGLAARVLNARGSLGWDVPVVAHTSLVSQEVRGLVDKPDYLKSVYGITYSSMVYDDTGRLPPKAQEFVERVGKSLDQFTNAPLFVPLAGAAMIQVYEAGVKKANSLDAAKVSAALQTAGPIETAVGRFDYTATDHNGFSLDSLEFVAAGSDKGYGNARLKLP